MTTNKFGCELLVLVAVVFVSCRVFSFSFMDDPHTKRVLCNSCHGEGNSYGYPRSGEHRKHVEGLLHSDKISNESYDDEMLEDPNPDDGVAVFGQKSVWDSCDECHHASVPYSQRTATFDCDSCHGETPDIPDLEEPDNVLHIDGEVKVVFMDTTATFNQVSRTCSGLDRCHVTAPVDNARWGRGGKTAKEIKEDFFESVCRDCHTNTRDVEQLTRDKIYFGRSVNSLCDRCHGEDEDQEVTVKHSLDFEITNEQRLSFPAAFPFEQGNIFTCSTCHSPHGEICQSCHSLNDRGVNDNKDVDRVFGGQVYDYYLAAGMSSGRQTVTPIRRSNVFLRTVATLDYDYSNHSFNYSDIETLKKNFCTACHAASFRNLNTGINIHLNFQCNDCHRELPYTKRICTKAEAFGGEIFPDIYFDRDAAVSGDINVACSSCHPKKHFHLPKLQLLINRKLPGDLKLSEWKELTCATCHDPHLKYGETGLIFKRLTDKGRGLCEVCHGDDKKFKSVNPHGRKDKCVYCHFVEPNRSRNLLDGEKKILSKDYISRCEICHSDWVNTHPINVYPFDDNELGLKLNRQDMLSCGSCHDYHEPKEIVIPKADADNGICGICHEI